MLSLTRKLCPFISFICLMSCGKKISEKDPAAKPLIESQVPSPTLIIAIEERVKTYIPKGSGRYKFPDQLRVRSRNALGKRVTITYNIPSEDPTSFEMKCFYKGTSEDQMPIQKCVDMSGDDLGDITDGEEHAIDEAIRFESDSDDLKADAIYDVVWTY